jgi:integrase
MDVKTAQTRVGHASSRTMLDVYAHALEELDQAAAATLDRMAIAAVIGRLRGLWGGGS